jgi:hypothetical protein
VRSRNDGYRWIDSLARWSVGGRDGSRPPVADRAAPDPAGGTTRRRALRSAAGAGVLALLGPMRFLDPTSAGAVTHAQECTAEATQVAQEDFEACFQNPLENYLTAGEHLDRAKKLLRTAKSPAERARLKKVIEFQTGQRRKASKAMEFCNKALLSDAAEGAAKCDASNPEPERLRVRTRKRALRRRVLRSPIRFLPGLCGKPDLLPDQRQLLPGVEQLEPPVIRGPGSSSKAPIRNPPAGAAAAKGRRRLRER